MNLSTFIIAAILAVILLAVAFSLYKKHKRGENSCSCQCDGCALRNQCHQENKEQDL